MVVVHLSRTRIPCHPLMLTVRDDDRAIRELDLVSVGTQDFHGRPNLAAHQTAIGQVGRQGHDIEKVN